MEIIPKGPVDRSAILKLHTQIGFELDHDFALFLEKNNGCVFKKCAVEIPAISRQVNPDLLFGINREPETSNILFWMNEYKGEIPDNAVLIGDASEGGLFLLVKNEGVYYWDHAWVFEQSDEEENTYFIAPTFTGFMDAITSAEG